MATQTPKDVLKFAKDNKVEMIDLKFLDFLGTWQHFAIPPSEMGEDLFEEGDEESAGLTPPAGQFEPIRGFGLVWREQLGGAEAEIGWAVAEEVGHGLTVQQFGGDIVIAAPGQLYWLAEDGTWERVAML